MTINRQGPSYRTHITLLPINLYTPTLHSPSFCAKPDWLCRLHFKLFALRYCFQNVTALGRPSYHYCEISKVFGVKKLNQTTASSLKIVPV